MSVFDAKPDISKCVRHSIAKTRTFVRFRARSFLTLVTLLFASLSVRSTCIGLSGAKIVPRHPSISEEYASTPWVFIGRATTSRNVASPDDPGFYDWTIYDVEVIEAFKGKLPHRVKLLSENTSGRFPMDAGKAYLLFVSHSPMIELAGNEKLPQDHVDNCGNSGAVKDVETTIRTVRALSGT
jgi:hypothetical protein